MKKTLILVFITILFYPDSFAHKKKYPSKEEDEYYKERDFVPFKPLETDFIVGFKSEYYEIHESVDYEPYSFDKYFTPYQDSIHKIQDVIYDKIHSYGSPATIYSKELPDSVNEIINGLYESLYLRTPECIGKIDKYRILKYEKKDNIEAFIYDSFEYGDIAYGEAGIWIGYSENNGKDWNYYYTGIVQQQPVFIKYYSPRPLIKENGKLEIEACLLRQLSPFGHPGPRPSYECVKDGIYLVFDMNIIAKDSDGDGLTDIFEDKLHLDKYNKDTDRDGIPDNMDMNPRIHCSRTEKSKVYEAILNNEIDWDERGVGRLLFNENAARHVTDSTETILIVTNDENLMGIQTQKYRVIFMITEEYKNLDKSYQTELKRMEFSPLKIDKKKDTYKIIRRFGTGGWEYLIRKTKEGWTIDILLTWIS